MCKLCQRKPKFQCNRYSIVVPEGQWINYKNEDDLVDRIWARLLVGVDENGSIYLVAQGTDIVGGDGRSERYYPKFCPECGRQLREG